MLQVEHQVNLEVSIGKKAISGWNKPSKHRFKPSEQIRACTSDTKRNLQFSKCQFDQICWAGIMKTDRTTHDEVDNRFTCVTCKEVRLICSGAKRCFVGLFHPEIASELWILTSILTWCSLSILPSIEPSPTTLFNLGLMPIGVFPPYLLPFVACCNMDLVKQIPPEIDGFLCGFGYGTTSVIVGQPLDTIKTRAQMKTYFGQSSYKIGSDIWKSEGIRGLYRGGSALVLGGAIIRSTQVRRYMLIHV